MQFLRYVTFSNADSRISIFFRNFERPFTAEQSSDRRETLAKRVSDDLQLFIFRRQKCFENNCWKTCSESTIFSKSGVLEELWIFDPRWQMRRKKLLPELPLFLGRLPCRRGKWFNMCFQPWLGIKNDFNHLVVWLDNNVIIWWYDNTKIW